MRWTRTGSALGLTVLLVGGTASGKTPQAPPGAGNPCLAQQSTAKGLPKFKDFLVAEIHLRGRVRPRLVSPDDRRYRTMLRSAALQGPDFAGHYKIAVIGCGASCALAAIIDERSGQVSFDPALKAVTGDYVASAPSDAPVLFKYKVDSRLLIVAGAPVEDESKDGLGFYEWTGRSFKLLKFIPGLQACSVGD